jgi:hypothetical protein
MKIFKQLKLNLFCSEVNNLDAGLLLEVWSKGVIWDKAVGYHWLHLRDIQHSNVVSHKVWMVYVTCAKHGQP